MAPRRKGPGRPPKRRGPGRPPGSKNKTKRIRPSVAARLAEHPKRGPGRPRKATVQMGVIMQPTAPDDLAEMRRDIATAGNILNRRLVDIEKKIEAMVADIDHPTTRMLASRLITLETSEKITHGTHERILQIEEEIRGLRRDLGEIIRERHEERNRDDVAKLAAEPENDEQPAFDDNWRKGRTVSGSEM